MSVIIDGEKEMMMNKERVCCICNEHKKFLSIINTGKKLYCMECEAKITKEYGSNYWKPCTLEEGFENLVNLRKNRTLFKGLLEIPEKDMTGIDDY